MRSRRLTTILLSVAVLASACGSDGDGAEPVDDTVATTDDTSGPTTTDDQAATETTEAGELTDSFRGVTAETIKLGVVIIDVEAVGRDNGDVEAKWQVAIDAVNEDGGVLGRQLEPVFAKYSPIGDVESEAACVELTQDAQVFAAMGPLRSSQLCFTEVNDTIFINTFGVSAEEYERSSAVVIGPGALPERSAALGIEALTDAGVLDGPVAIHAAADAGDERAVYATALADAGVDVVSETQSTVSGDDVAAVEAEMQAFSQVWSNDGAEIVLAIGAGSGLNVVGGLANGNYAPQLVLTNPSDFEPSLYRDLGYTTDALDGAVATGFRSFDDLAEAGDAGTTECIDRFEAASGESVNINPTDDEVVNLPSTIWACQAIDIFVQVAEAAGTDLTNDSFRSAAESLGEMTVTGVEEASIGEGKFDIGDGLPLLLTYDAGADDFVPLS